MAKTRKRVWALLMTLVMVLSLLPTAALASGFSGDYDSYGKNDGSKNNNGPVAHFYILKPSYGTDLGAVDSQDYKTRWEYAGQGLVDTKSLGNPTASKREVPYQESNVTEFPAANAFPVLTFGGEEYRYDSEGTKKPGTYSVTWVRFVDASGYNIGDTAHDSNKGTWHVDGFATPNIAEKCTVNYYVLDGSDNERMPRKTVNIDKNGTASDYTAQDLKITLASNEQFDGWYTDDSFEKPYDFETPVTDELNLYARISEKTPSLTITKVVTGTDDTTSRTFEFQVLAAGTSVTKTASITVKGDGTESVNVYDLEPGEYTVLESDAADAVSTTYSPEGGLVTVSDGQTATITVTNDYTVPAPYLTIAKTADAASIVAGENVTYTVTVKNDGTAACSGETSVTDTLPAGLTLVSATSEDGAVTTSGGTVTNPYVTINWTLPETLDVQETATLTVVATVNESNAHGTEITNTAIVIPPEGVGTNGSADAEISVIGKTGFTVTKAFSGALSAAPAGFDATLTLTGTTGEYEAEYADGKFTFTALPYGTYTVTEDVDAAFESFSGKKDGENGTFIFDGASLEEITVNDESVAAGVTLTNTYSFVKDTQVSLRYAWDVSGAYVAWPADLGTDPLDGYNENPLFTDFTVGNLDTTKLPDMPTVSASQERYEMATIQWLMEDAQGNLVPVTNALLAAIPGGTTETLYARLLDNTAEPHSYQVKYQLITRVDGEKTGTKTVNIDTVSNVSAEPDKSELWADCDEFYTDGFTIYQKGAVEEVSTSGSFLKDTLVYTVTYYHDTYTVGTLQITKTFTGDLNGTEKELDDFSITVTGPNDYERTLDLKPIATRANGVYFWTLKNLAAGTYTVTENYASVPGYTWTVTAAGYDKDTEPVVDASSASYEVTVELDGTAADLSITNDYDMNHLTVLFDGGAHGKVVDNGNPVVDGIIPYIRVNYGENGETDIGWAKSPKVEETGVSQVKFSFDRTDVYETSTMNTTTPTVQADQGWVCDGNFYSADYHNGQQAFTSLREAAEYMLDNGLTTLTFAPNYTNPGNPGGGGSSGGSTTIPDEDTPTTDLPDEDTPTTDLPDENVPTTDLPDESTPTTDLPDEEVPMAEAPKTGDNLTAWILAAGVSGLGLVWLALGSRKRGQENA